MDIKTEKKILKTKTKAVKIKYFLKALMNLYIKNTKTSLKN